MGGNRRLRLPFEEVRGGSASLLPNWVGFLLGFPRLGWAVPCIGFTELCAHVCTGACEEVLTVDLFGVIKWTSFEGLVIEPLGAIQRTSFEGLVQRICSHLCHKI